MSIIKITAKRQATLPMELCNELGVQPGDSLKVEKKLVEGERVWTFVPHKPSTAWFGSLKRYAQGKSHEMEDIRASIGKAIGPKK